MKQIVFLVLIVFSLFLVPIINAESIVIEAVEGTTEGNQTGVDDYSTGLIVPDEVKAYWIGVDECSSIGDISTEGIYNENSDTWWFDLTSFEEIEGCNPACVVNLPREEAEVNWRCTGLKPVCISEGETGNYFDEDVCCSGLTRIGNSFVSGGGCVAPTNGRFKCTNCGDTVCGDGENSCNCPADCGKCEVAVFVDEETYNGISDDLETYRQDIENDMGVNVCIYHDTWETPQELKDIIRDLYKDGLIGVVLVGDVPMAFFVNGDERKPADYYYSEMDNGCYLTGEDTFRFTYTEESLPEIWVGRIKPPVTGEAGIELLSDYFEKNHRYRNGEIVFPNTALYFSDNDIYEDREGSFRNESDYVSRMEIFYRDIYDAEELDYVYSHDVDVLRNDYLSKLSQPHESVHMGSHGSEIFQVIHNDTEKRYIRPFDLIENTNPNAIYIALSNCNTGDFSTENYLAGWYLFSGNTLVVRGQPFVTEWFPDELFKAMRMLRLGMNFGDHWLNTNGYSIGVALLGDPTLTLREKPTGPQPHINQSYFEINFGEVPVGNTSRKELFIFNSGEDTLTLTSGTGASSFNDGEGTGGSILYPISHIVPNPIDPGETGKIVFNFDPSSSEGKYSYTGIWRSNDPNNPFITIRLIGYAVLEEGSEYTTETKAIEVEVFTLRGASTISIEKIDDVVSIKSNGISAITFGKIFIEENKLYLETSTGNKRINLLPEEASSKATEITTVKEIELKEENTRPIYLVKGEKSARIFAIFPVTLEIETKVSAETGEVISVKKPWWSFLAW